MRNGNFCWCTGRIMTGNRIKKSWNECSIINEVHCNIIISDGLDPGYYFPVAEWDFPAFASPTVLPKMLLWGRTVGEQCEGVLKQEGRMDINCQFRSNSMFHSSCSWDTSGIHHLIETNGTNALTHLIAWTSKNFSHQGISRAHKSFPGVRWTYACGFLIGMLWKCKPLWGSMRFEKQDILICELKAIWNILQDQRTSHILQTELLDANICFQ